MNPNATTSTADDRQLDPEDVCSLPPETLDARRAWIRRELLPHALRREVLAENEVVYHFRRAPDIVRALERLVVLEGECCSAIDFRVEAPTGGGPRLFLRGVDPEAPILAGPDEQVAAPAGRLRRAAGALALGSAAGLLVCCVLPLGVAALFGAAAGAALGWMDQPLVIAVVALVAAVGAHRWLTRRGCDDGC